MTGRLHLALCAVCAASALACSDDPVTAADAARPRPALDLGAWTPPPDGGRLIYLAPSPQAEPGDGTRSRPFGRAADAYAAFAPGDVITLLPGDYGALPAPPEGARLVGAGPETTVDGPLTLSDGQTLQALTLRGGGLTLSGDSRLVGVTLAGGEAPVARIDGASQWDEVVITQVAGPPQADDLEAPPPCAVVVGPEGALAWRGGAAREVAAGVLRADGGTVSLHTLDFTAFDGFGVYQAGGALALVDVRMHAPLGAGVRTVDAVAEIRGLRVIDPRTDPIRNTASGVGVIGGEVTVTQSYLRGGDRSVRVAAGGRLTLAESVADSPGTDGLGLGAGSHGDVRDFTVLAPRNVGVSVVDGATAQLSQVEVRRPGRIGLLVSGDAFAAVDGLRVLDAVTRGVSVLNAGARLTGLQVQGAADVCVQITDATGEVTVQGATLSGCGTTGLAALGAMPEGLSLIDVTVTGTVDAGQQLAIGVHLYQTGAYIEGLTAHDNQGPGLQVEQSGARLVGGTLTDNGGPGAVVLDATGEVVLEGLTAERNPGAGVLAINSEVRLVSPTLVGNRADLAEGPGDGAAAFIQASLTIEGGLSLENDGNGAAATINSGLTLGGGVRLEANGGFGAYAACDGSTLTGRDAGIYAGNRQGPSNACP